MSRNLGSRCCVFCNGDVKCIEVPRDITRADCSPYFDDYKGMVVAFAECEDCEAPYLAWLDGSKVDGGWGYPNAEWIDGRLVPGDLSHRGSFNDEPGIDDFPKYKIRVEKIREPWPMCGECGAPLEACGTCSREYRHKKEAS